MYLFELGCQGRESNSFSLEQALRKVGLRARSVPLPLTQHVDLAVDHGRAEAVLGVLHGRALPPLVLAGVVLQQLVAQAIGLVLRKIRLCEVRQRAT